MFLNPGKNNISTDANIQKHFWVIQGFENCFLNLGTPDTNIFSRRKYIGENLKNKLADIWKTFPQLFVKY